MTINEPPEILANAGTPYTMCANETYQLGGSPTGTGGMGGFTYTWSPSTSLDDPNSPNRLGPLDTG